MANKTANALKKQIRKLEGLLSTLDSFYKKTGSIIEASLEEATAALEAEGGAAAPVKGTGSVQKTAAPAKASPSAKAKKAKVKPAKAKTKAKKTSTPVEED